MFVILMGLAQHICKYADFQVLYRDIMFSGYNINIPNVNVFSEFIEAYKIRETIFV